MNGELELAGWAFGVASGLFAIFCVVAAVRLSRRSFPEPRQSFAAYHRRLRRAELRRYLKGTHLR